MIHYSLAIHFSLQVLKQQNQDPLVMGSQDQAEEKSDALHMEQEVEHFKRVKFHYDINFYFQMFSFLAMKCPAISRSL